VRVDPGPPVDDLAWKALEACAAECRRCPLWAERRQVVFGEGDRNARLMFIGEGPGREEDEQGIPFVGPAGHLLTRMIEAMGLRRADVYIANIVKCHPPRNRNPEEAEVTACLPFLRRQIALVGPEVIVLLGGVPLRALFGETGITRQRGRWRELEGIPVLPTYHPAYLLRVPRCKREVWTDLQSVMRRLGLEPPTPAALAAEVERCRACPLHESREQPVPGTGAAAPELFFLDEAPNADADRTGNPFAGDSGALLGRMITAMGYRPEEVFTTSLVKCRPPAGRPPNETEIAACLPHLRQQLRLLRPKAVVLFGETVLRAFCRETDFEQARGRWLECEGIPALATFAPAFLLEHPERKGDAWRDLQVVMKRFDRHPNPTPS
jgi:DNA polymerase